MLVRGHLRQSSTLWQQIAPLLACQPRTDGDRMARAWLLAYGWMNQGEYAKAIALVDEILPDARRAEKPSRTALLLMVRGMARLHTAGGPARADFEEALAMARAAGDRLVLGVALEHYGVLLCLDGDPDRASALHREMLSVARSLDDENLRAEAHYVLAVDALADGDAGSAAPHLAAAIRHYQNLGHFEGLARCLAALSALALQRGDPHLAARLIGTAAEVRDRFGGSGLRPWPWAAQAEQPTIDQAKALLPGGEYTAQLATGRSQTIDEALAAATPILQERQPAAPR